MAVNPVGSVVDAAGRFWAQAQALDVGWRAGIWFAVAYRPSGQCNAHPMTGSKLAAALTNTTIGVVAVAADLTVAEAKRVAIMAQDGLARAIRPVHTPFDGDTIFVLATGAEKLTAADEARPLALAELGALAADCVSRAVARGVFEAASLGDARAYRDRFDG